MHMKIGQIKDVRALLDEKKCFLKIPIFDVNTAIRNFSKFTHFLQIFYLYRDFEILHIDTCKLITVNPPICPRGAYLIFPLWGGGLIRGGGLNRGGAY